MMGRDPIGTSTPLRLLRQPCGAVLSTGTARRALFGILAPADQRRMTTRAEGTQGYARLRGNTVTLRYNFGYATTRAPAFCTARGFRLAAFCNRVRSQPY
jgi:hypothetical protein